MAVIIEGVRLGLIDRIKQEIDSGRVHAWTYDDDGDFTLTDNEWNRRAWMRPRAPADDRIVVNIVAQQTEEISVGVYAAFHVRFVEMLLKFFDRQFDRVVTTAMPTARDL